jgi:hypothetical protein
MYQREDQNLSSLTWIAETYYGLAQSSLDNASESKTYFERASSTFVSILDRSKKDKEFKDKDRLAGVRLRLANCKRRQGEFQEAETMLKQLIVERKGDWYRVRFGPSAEDSFIVHFGALG